MSGPVRAWLTRGFTKAEDQRPTWHGGAYAVDSSIGQMLCDPDPAVQALGEELLPVLRWCVASTAVGDVCALVPDEPGASCDDPVLRRHDRHLSVRGGHMAAWPSEADFQRQVTDLATMLGWRWVHFRPARVTRDGQESWRTAVSGPLGKGWPDLVLVRGERLIFAELKKASGRATPTQEAVLDAFRGVPAAEVHVWQAGTLNSIHAVLR